MVNQEELAICKKRGHEYSHIHGDQWAQCEWCGMWLREVRTIEEREDDPPKSEQSPLSRPPKPR